MARLPLFDRLMEVQLLRVRFRTPRRGLARGGSSRRCRGAAHLRSSSLPPLRSIRSQGLQDSHA
ncbi:UNVERIFIED_CONTAM: hypothetical protein HHA_462620 [Hammondia hammondi]|eukprot:XP_008887787.1 hypothetical protein HHA_462620 [Hammondia hammondi]